MAVREIVKDEAILSQKSDKVEKGEDINQVIRDLLDTANEHKETCIGLSAIQIGYTKRVCIVKTGDDSWLTIINPMIIQHSPGHHQSTEGCLSFPDTPRTTKRWDSITIMHDVRGKMVKRKFGKIHAVIVQHEMDHMNGILI